MFGSLFVYAQKPISGTYTYSIAFTEWQGKFLGATCTVRIKGDSVTIIHNGNSKLSGAKGDVIDQGILMKHTKTGKWIIAHSAKDKSANEVGGCSEGPRIIDFKRRKVWLC